jgi:hypothetical protein
MENNKPIDIFDLLLSFLGLSSGFSGFLFFKKIKILKIPNQTDWFFMNWSELVLSFFINIVASLPWVLERRRLLHLRRCSTAAGRAGRGRPDKPWATRAVGVGHAPLCKWIECSFGPVAVGLNFLFSEYIQIFANLKKLCRIHLNSGNYETNFC